MPDEADRDDLFSSHQPGDVSLSGRDGHTMWLGFRVVDGRVFLAASRECAHPEHAQVRALFAASLLQGAYPPPDTVVVQRRDGTWPVPPPGADRVCWREVIPDSGRPAMRDRDVWEPVPDRARW